VEFALSVGDSITPQNFALYYLVHWW